MYHRCKRSQAVARIAKRAASQHLWGSRDVIGHVIIWQSICHFLLVVLWNQASISNSFRDIQRRMSRNGWHDLDTTSKRRSRSSVLVPIDFWKTQTKTHVWTVTRLVHFQFTLRLQQKSIYNCLMNHVISQRCNLSRCEDVGAVQLCNVSGFTYPLFIIIIINIIDIIVIIIIVWTVCLAGRRHWSLINGHVKLLQSYTSPHQQCNDRPAACQWTDIDSNLQL